MAQRVSDAVRFVEQGRIQTKILLLEIIIQREGERGREGGREREGEGGRGREGGREGERGRREGEGGERESCACTDGMT